MEVGMLMKAMPFVATLLGAISCAAHATPLQLGDAELDRIFAGNGNGNGNGNIGSYNGNNNQGNNNGNNNQGNNNGNNNNTNNNGNNNNSSNNGNNDSGSGSSDDVLRVQDVLRDALTDIIVFNDGSAADDVGSEVKLRIYRTRLALAKANEQDDKVERLERKIERFVAEHPEAAAAAERKRRNGITSNDVDFLFSGDAAPDPKKGLQRIINQGYKLYGHDASGFSRFTERLRMVIYD
jgi:hypothetical protein